MKSSTANTTMTYKYFILSNNLFFLFYTRPQIVMVPKLSFRFSHHYYLFLSGSEI